MTPKTDTSTVAKPKIPDAKISLPTGIVSVDSGTVSTSTTSVVDVGGDKTVKHLQKAAKSKTFPLPDLIQEDE